MGTTDICRQQYQGRLGSEFILGLLSKYPKACSRSLTNLSAIGIRKAEANTKSEFTTPKSIKKTLCTSQPELCTEYTGYTRFGSGIDIEPVSSGFYMPPTDDHSSALNPTPTDITRQLEDNKMRFSKLALKIKELSRSNQSLFDRQDSIPQSSPSHFETQQNQLHFINLNIDDEDDSAPVATDGHMRQPAAPSTSTYNTSSPNVTAKSDARDKLEELRARLTEKCLSLQKRRDALDSRLNLSKTSTSVSQSVSSSETRHKSAVKPYSEKSSYTRVSGKDSDGDSGIEVSQSKTENPCRNSLVPKLKKDSLGSARLSVLKASLPEGDRYTSMSPESCVGLLATSRALHLQANELKDSQLSLSISSPRSGASLPSKTVRFSQTPDVIREETPKLRELKQLSEELKLNTQEKTALPDTELTGYDSETDSVSISSDSHSLSNLSDMTDIDPRILNFASGSLSKAEALTPSIKVHDDYQHSTGSDGRLSSSEETVLPSSPSPQLVTQRPPKPPRLNQSKPSRLPVPESDNIQPYAVVDIKSLRKCKSQCVIEGSAKPPLPKCLPPSESSAAESSSLSSFSAADCTPTSSSNLTRPASSVEDLWGSNASLYSPEAAVRLQPDNTSLSSSKSRSSLFGRVGSFKDAAKKKMKSIKRSLSLDRLTKSSKLDLSAQSNEDQLSKNERKESPVASRKANEISLPNSPPLPGDKKTEIATPIPEIKKSLSLKSLKNLKFSSKTKKAPHISKPTTAQVVDVENPNHFRPIGKVLKVNKDGSRNIRLNKPPHGPYGFYLGESPDSPGLFVTRLSDSYPDKFFSGLLSVGDKIKSVNGIVADQMDINNAYDIMSKSKSLEICVQPLLMQ